jgi:hypothetical protein
MPIFALEQINTNETRAPVYYLHRDGICLIDSFITMAKANPDYEPLLSDLYAIVRRIANGEAVPSKLFAKVKGQKTAWEARKGDIRMYVYREGNGPIVVIGGDKNSQSGDLEQLKTIIKEFKIYKNGNEIIFVEG